MAARYIRSKDKDAAAEYATWVAGSERPTYWHCSLAGFRAGIRYTRKEKLKLIIKGRVIRSSDSRIAYKYAWTAPFVRNVTTYWAMRMTDLSQECDMHVVRSF